MWGNLFKLPPKKKIILITVGRLPTNENVSDEFFISGKLREEFFHRGGSWTFPISQNMVKHTDAYDIECWNVYSPRNYGDMGIYRKEENGVTFIQFPATSIAGKLISLPLFRELRRRVRSKEEIIVHTQGLHSWPNYILAFMCRNVPLVTQQRAPSFPPMIKNVERKNAVYRFLQPIDDWCLRYYDFIFVPSLGEYGYLQERIGSENIHLQKGQGFPFSEFEPGKKEDVRRELGLPLDKKIMVHLGRFNERKGLPVILETFKTLRENGMNVDLLLVGGKKNQPLYEEAKASGAILTGHIPKKDVIRYLNASDVYLVPTEDKVWIPFGDIDNGAIEALAMNVPVVGPTLIHFPGSPDERKELGRITTSREEVLKAVREILTDKDGFQHTRKTIQNYYSWDRIISRFEMVYERLSGKYYGNS
jgi:glycosyltransferase involved in cell wall biosynthesis